MEPLPRAPATGLPQRRLPTPPRAPWGRTQTAPLPPPPPPSRIFPKRRPESLAQPSSSSSTQTPKATEPTTKQPDKESNPRKIAEELKEQRPAPIWRSPQKEVGPEAEGDIGQGAEPQAACEEEVSSRILDPATEEGRAEEGRAEELWSPLLPPPLPLPQLPPLPPPPHPVVGAHVRLQHCRQHPDFNGKEGTLTERAEDGRWHMSLVGEQLGFHLRFVKEINFAVLHRPNDEAPPTKRPKLVKAKFPMPEPRPPVIVRPRCS